MMSWAVGYSSLKLFAKDFVIQLNFDEVQFLFLLSLATKQDK